MTGDQVLFHQKRIGRAHGPHDWTDWWVLAKPRGLVGPRPSFTAYCRQDGCLLWDPNEGNPTHTSGPYLMAPRPMAVAGIGHSWPGVVALDVRSLKNLLVPG